MRKSIIVSIIGVALISINCNNQPTQDGGVKFGNPLFPNSPQPSKFTGYSSSNWTNANQTVNHPPNECDCAPGLRLPRWTGANWVCSDQLGNREMPSKDAFCKME